MAWPGQQVGREGEQGRAWEGSAQLLQPGRWRRDVGGQPGRGAERCTEMTAPEEEEEQESVWTEWRGCVQTRSARSQTRHRARLPPQGCGEDACQRPPRSKAESGQERQLAQLLA